MKEILIFGHGSWDKTHCWKKLDARKWCKAEIMKSEWARQIHRNEVPSCQICLAKFNDMKKEYNKNIILPRLLMIVTFISIGILVFGVLSL